MSKHELTIVDVMNYEWNDGAAVTRKDWRAKWECSCDTGNWAHFTKRWHNSPGAARAAARVEHHSHVVRMMEMTAEIIVVDEEHSRLF